MPRPAEARFRLPTVEETSAGGLVMDRLSTGANVAVIGRRLPRARLIWALPKGHVEAGETLRGAALREVSEETGIVADIVSRLGTITYRFLTRDRCVRKTVHHYLMIATHGELHTGDVAVDEVAWVRLDQLPTVLTHANERGIARQAHELLAGRR